MSGVLSRLASSRGMDTGHWKACPRLILKKQCRLPSLEWLTAILILGRTTSTAPPPGDRSSAARRLPDRHRLPRHPRVRHQRPLPCEIGDAAGGARSPQPLPARLDDGIPLPRRRHDGGDGAGNPPGARLRPPARLAAVRAVPRRRHRARAAHQVRRGAQPPAADLARGDGRRRAAGLPRGRRQILHPHLLGDVGTPVVPRLPVPADGGSGAAVPPHRALRLRCAALRLHADCSAASGRCRHRGGVAAAVPLPSQPDHRLGQHRHVRDADAGRRGAGALAAAGGQRAPT